MSIEQVQERVADIQSRIAALAPPKVAAAPAAPAGAAPSPGDFATALRSAIGTAAAGPVPARPAPYAPVPAGPVPAGLTSVGDAAGTAAGQQVNRAGAATGSASAQAGGLPAWTAQLPAAARQHVPALVSAGDATGVDPRLLAAVAWTESGFSATARSGAGAVGLMQLMPATARGLGVDPSDPAQSALGAARYLAEQLRAQDGRLGVALAAYNAGPGAVRRYGGIPPYEETQNYVRTVLSRYTVLTGPS